MNFVRLVALGALLMGCADNPTIEEVALRDLRCDAVRVFVIDGPDNVEAPLFRGRNECSDQIVTRYRVEGCQRSRAYRCVECESSLTESGPSCTGDGPVALD